MDEKDVLNRLKEKGFLLEIEVYQELEEDGWNVAAQDYYVDQDEGKPRTIDLTGIKRFGFKEWFGKQPLVDFLHTTLVVECKKSDNSLVFYMTKRGRLFEEIMATGIVRHTLNPRIELSVLDVSEKLLSKSHHYLPDRTRVAVN